VSQIGGFIGLCCRAGQITLGADMALQEIRAERAGLALLDAGASEGTRKKILDACDYHRVPVYILPEGELSRATGREGRMAAAVKKGGLCRKISEILSQNQEAKQ